MNYEVQSPQALREESMILGAILLGDRGGLNEVLEHAVSRDEPLTEKDFFFELHRYWYKSFLQLHSEGTPVNLATVQQFCNDKYTRIPLAGFVDEVESDCMNPDRRTLSELIDVVQDKCKRRDLIAKYQEQSAYLFDPFTPTDEAIARFQSSVASFGDEQIGNDGLLHISESLIGTFNKLEARMNGEVEAYLRTGWGEFDKRFGGVPNGMTILMGRPAMGKTAAALTIALNAATRHQSVLIFSLEMDADQLNNRFLSMITGIAGNRITSGQLYDGEMEKIVEAIAYLSELDINIMDCPTSVEDVQRKVTAWGRKHNRKPDLVIIDYLQLLVSEKKSRDAYAEVSHISRQLQRLAKFFKVRPGDRSQSFPLIAVCQLSRAVEARSNKRPIMSDLRDSGQLEQDAEFIVGFYRDEYYNANSPDIGVAEAIAVKNRDAPVGTVKLLFQAETTRFYDFNVEV